MGVHVQSRGGVMNVDQDTMQVLTMVFQEPSTAMKVMVPSSPCKVPADLYLPLLKTPEVEERTKEAGNILEFPLGINPDLHRASFEMSFEALMAFGYLEWHSALLISYLFDKCQDDPVLNAVCSQL